MKTAVVTGGATGIGRSVSSLLAENGYNIIIGYNTSEEAANHLAELLCGKGLSAIKKQVDVASSQSVSELFKFAVDKFGSVDLLVNNAGIAQQKLLSDITDTDWQNMLSVNLGGCFNCCREASRIMIKNHSGCIINISSMWGIVGASCESHYSAAKAGVIGLTKSLAKEIGPSNIRVNAVSPGVILTNMLNSFTAEDLKALADETPLCRLGTPDDVANAVMFLASDKASFITGQNLSVDGGFII